MSPSPAPILGIIFLVIAFESALFGEDLVEQSFPTIESPAEEDCSGFFDGFACGVRAFFNFFRTIWGVLLFVWNALTFNIPGAPMWVRVPISVLTFGSLGWMIITKIRGA